MLPATFVPSTALFFLLAPLAVAAPQSPLTALVDWKDGRVADGVGPASAVEAPQEERFWIGQGLRRAQIEIGSRERRFEEELGPDQNYQTSIVDMELDESSVSTEDHRLFVLTSFQSKLPNQPAVLQMLGVETPSAPFEFDAVDIDHTPPLPADPDYTYEPTAIDVYEEEQLVLVVGRAIEIATDPTEAEEFLLLLLYRYGPYGPNGAEVLDLLLESRVEQIPLLDCDGTGRNLFRPQGVTMHRIGDDLVAFLRVGILGAKKPAPGAIALFLVDADAPVAADRLQLLEGTDHIFDPVHYALCSGEPVPPVPPNTTLTGEDLSVNDFDFVVDETGPEPVHLLYLACGRYHQVLVFDVTDVVASGFQFSCAPIWPQRLDLGVPPPNVDGTQEIMYDNLFAITARHDPVEDVNLIYVVGEQYLHVANRFAGVNAGDPCQGLLPPERAVLQQYFGGSPSARAQVMLEFVTPEQVQNGQSAMSGEREHFWVVAHGTPFPWSIFDMTDRFLDPAVEVPGIVERTYSPGGTDGAVMLESETGEGTRRDIYVPSFGGVVRYDFAFNGDFESPAVSTFAPNYESYQPALIGNTAHVTEQLELAVLVEDDPNTALFDADVRLYAPNGRGGILQWVIDPATRNPLPASLYSGNWQKIWAAGGYSLRTVFGYGQISNCPYVMVDLGREKPSPAGEGCDEPHELAECQSQVLLGRLWLPCPEATPGPQLPVPWTWQVLVLDDPTDVNADCQNPSAPASATDPLNLVRGFARDVALSPTGQWALVACTEGLFVVQLYGGAHGGQVIDLNWQVNQTFYPFDTCLRPDPFGNGRAYSNVEGACWLETQHVVLSLSDVPDAGALSSGGLALFEFDHHLHLLGDLVTELHDRPGSPGVAAVDEIPGTDFYMGGSLRSHLLPDGTYRLYATSNFSGAVVEYEFDPFQSGPSSLTHLSTWSDGTHLSETTDCRAYDVGHPDGVPLVLVSRYLQTVAVLAATGFEVEEEP
jgi:hypothetical protein